MKSFLLTLTFAFCAAACGEPVKAPQIGNQSDAGEASDSGDGAVSDVAVGGSDDGAGVDGGPAPDCVPSRDAWAAHAQGFVERYCSECHTSPPQFGAPYSLQDYDAIVAGAAGDRIVDRMLSMLLAGEMPPPTSPQLDHVALDTLVEWASCGQKHPDHTEGLVASAPVHQAPPDPPAGTQSFDVTAGEWVVGPTVIDDFRCFAVEVPVTESRLVRRIEPVVDDGRVLHHIVVAIDRSGRSGEDSFFCPGTPPGDDLVYAWGPGLGALQFPDGGIRIEPEDKFVLQIHYNNGAGATDVADSSGFRVYHTETGATEWTMSEAGTLSIDVPDGETVTAQGSCTIDRDVRLFATWPHMHEIGSAFQQTVERVDGTTDTIVELTGWNFEAQLLYDTPMALNAGDRVVTKCTWENDSGRDVSFGTRTEDEMCFGFLYTTGEVCRVLGL